MTIRKSASRKGQVFSGDFVISIAVFLFVLVIILPLFGYVSERVHASDERQDLENRLLFVSEALVKSTGYPPNWNSTTVVTAGFADAGALNITKIRNFLDMQYADAQNSMALAGVNFNISFTDLHGFSMFTGASSAPVAYFLVSSNMTQAHLDESSIVWDMYYGNTGDVPASNARNVYTGTKIGVFNNMVANQSAYKTIIIEKPGLTQAEVNIEQLKNFVSTGGVLIFIGPADLLATGFSVTTGQQTAENGVVTATADFVNASIGSAVIFGDPSWYVANLSSNAPLEILVASVLNNSRAMIGVWNHGLGTVFYITDLAGTVNGQSLSKSLNIIGSKMEYGTPLPQQGTILVANRNAILKKRANQFVSMRLSLWI